MSGKRLPLILAIVLLASCTSGRHTTSSSFPLRVTRDVALPGRPTRFDYQAVDAASRHLYIAHLGDSTVDVIDLATFRVEATIPGIEQVHGVAVAPQLHRIFATATGTNQLVAIQIRTNRVLWRSPTGSFPDGVAYDPDDQLVFVSNKDDGSIASFDAREGTAITTIRLGGEAGNVTYDARARLIYAAVHAPDELDAINPRTRSIVRRIPLAGCDGAHGIYLDLDTPRAFVACERNARLVTVDLTSATPIGTTTVGTDPDVLASDARLHRLYVAAESGTVTGFDTAPRTIDKIGEERLAANAHTVAVDPTTGNVFFPIQHVHGHPTLRVMQPPAH